MLDQDDQGVEGIFRSEPRKTNEVGSIKSASIEQRRSNSLELAIAFLAVEADMTAD